MKKLFPILIGLMLVMSVIVLASPPVPKPIRGYFKINDHNIAGYVVEIENLRTGEVVSGNERIELITQSGGFAFDLSFFRASGYAEPIPGIYAGDPIEVRVVGVPDGKVRFNVPSVTPYEVTIQLRVDPSVETSLVYVCSDGSYVKDKSLCPVEVPVEPTVVIEEKIVEKVVEVPSEDKDIPWLLEALGALVMFVLGYLGYKYKWLNPLMKAWQSRIKKADTSEKKKKAIIGATKTIKTVTEKDKAGKYKK